jgi:hypothetical protein
VIARQLVDLNSTRGHPTPAKKWILLEEVTWRLMFCPEKVDPSRKRYQFVALTRGEADLLKVKDS